MNKDVLIFDKVKVNHDLITEIWQFDPRTLDTIDGVTLSKYNIALAQYLIYFTYQRNITKAEVYKLNKYIERTLSLILSSDKELLKKYKTKTAAADFIISKDEELMKVQGDLDVLQRELIHIDGMDKVISELIATIKRELTRRENDLYEVRMERRR